MFILQKIRSLGLTPYDDSSHEIHYRSCFDHSRTIGMTSDEDSNYESESQELFDDQEPMANEEDEVPASKQRKFDTQFVDQTEVEEVKLKQPVEKATIASGSAEQQDIANQYAEEKEAEPMQTEDEESEDSWSPAEEKIYGPHQLNKYEMIIIIMVNRRKNCEVNYIRNKQKPCMEKRSRYLKKYKLMQRSIRKLDIQISNIKIDMLLESYKHSEANQESSDNESIEIVRSDKRTIPYMSEED